MVRRDKGYRPPLLHWPGTGHWTRWPEGRNIATSHLVDTYRELYPDAARRLVDNWNLELQIGGAQDIDLYNGLGFWSSMVTGLCVQCNVLRTGQLECEYFDGFFCDRCRGLSLLALCLCVLAPLGCIGAVRWRRGDTMAPRSRPTWQARLARSKHPDFRA
mmetsp:Transcript_587/g.1135  ORF Transcript_587/g.1135 Transcript_587/m.1135 type:complete len:160 (+) Transcript_587:3-482(+)